MLDIIPIKVNGVCMAWNGGVPIARRPSNCEAQVRALTGQKPTFVNLRERAFADVSEGPLPGLRHFLASREQVGYKADRLLRQTDLGRTVAGNIA